MTLAYNLEDATHFYRLGTRVTGNFTSRKKIVELSTGLMTSVTKKQSAAMTWLFSGAKLQPKVKNSVEFPYI